MSNKTFEVGDNVSYYSRVVRDMQHGVVEIVWNNPSTGNDMLGVWNDELPGHELVRASIATKCD